MKKEFLTLMSVFILGVSIYLLLPTNDDSIEKVGITKLNNEENKKINNEIILSFDIIRITKNGDAVLAGRSLPGIRFGLYDKNLKIAEIASDANGEWVWTSQEAMIPGAKEFNLIYLDKNGKQHTSDQSIVVFIEENKGSEPFVLKSDKEGNSNSLVLNLEDLTDDFSLDLVEYSPKGRLMLSGRSKMSDKILLFLNDYFIGESLPDSTGLWTFLSNDSYEYKKANLRLEVSANNLDSKKSFVTDIFDHDLDNMKGKSLIVQPGNSLWRISRSILGGGVLYTEIFKNNIEIIKNPDLIYPGQVLKLPIISKEYASEE